jgi:hypothetical protein
MGIPMSIAVAIGMHHREPLGTVGGEDLSVLPLTLALITTVFAAQAAFDRKAYNRRSFVAISSPLPPFRSTSVKCRLIWILCGQVLDCFAVSIRNVDSIDLVLKARCGRIIPLIAEPPDLCNG